MTKKQGHLRVLETRAPRSARAMTDIDQFKHVEELFNAALDLPAEHRYAYLECACGRDKVTLETVVRLLRHVGISLPVDWARRPSCEAGRARRGC